jgi:hypothetical protein
MLPSYAAWKAIAITALSLSVRCNNQGSTYQLVGIDANSINWVTTLDVSGGDPTDASDFTTNVLSLCNKSEGAPVAAFSVPSFSFQGSGLQFVASSGTMTTAYYKVTSYGSAGLSISGGHLYTQGMSMGDTANIQIVDKDGVMFAPGHVVTSYATNWNVSPTGDQGHSTPYASYIPGGFYIALIYNSVGTSPVTVGFNMFLHAAK